MSNSLVVLTSFPTPVAVLCTLLEPPKYHTMPKEFVSRVPVFHKQHIHLACRCCEVEITKILKHSTTKDNLRCRRSPSIEYKHIGGEHEWAHTCALLFLKNEANNTSLILAFLRFLTELLFPHWCRNTIEDSHKIVLDKCIPTVHGST